MQIPAYKLTRGLVQKPDEEVSEGFEEFTDLDLAKTGRAQAVLDNDIAITYGEPVHSMTMEGLVTVDPLLVGVGTDLRSAHTVLKSNFSGEDLDFASLTGRIYMTNPTDGMWSYDGGGTLYRAGTPTATPAPAVADSGTASTSTFQGIYNIKVTYVNSHSFDGNPTDATAGPNITDTQLSVTSIPVNSDADYNITARHIWIQGGTSPQYSSYVLAKTISDNITTSVLIDVADIDSSTLLEEDNDTPPAGKFIFENYGVLFMGGFTDSASTQSLRFSKTAEGESWPLASDLNISRSSDPLMEGVAWNGSGWIITRKRIFQIIGSPGQGTILTNFYVKETKSTAGTIASRSVVPTPYGIFFWAEDGIRKFDGDQSSIFSNDVEDLVNERNQLTEYESKIQGAFFNDLLIYSFIPDGSTTHDRALVYDFRTGQWRRHGKGYLSFAEDRKNNVLFCGTVSGVERFQKGSTYRAWELRKNGINAGVDNLGFWGKFQVDLEGEATAEIYQDGVLAQSYTLAPSGRDYVPRRFPSGVARRIDLRLYGSASATRAVIRHISISGEGGRGQI